MFCPSAGLIINWYFPLSHSTPSEVTLIFMHHSRLRVNFQDLFKSARSAAQTLQRRLLWRWLCVLFEEKITRAIHRGIFSHSAGCLHTSRSDLIQMSCFLRSLSFLYLNKMYGFTDSHGTLSIKHTSADVDLQYSFEGRAYSNPRPCGLNLHPLLLYLSLTFVLREAVCNSEHVEGPTVYNNNGKKKKKCTVQNVGVLLWIFCKALTYWFWFFSN